MEPPAGPTDRRADDEQPEARSPRANDAAPEDG